MAVWLITQVLQNERNLIELSLYGGRPDRRDVSADTVRKPSVKSRVHDIIQNKHPVSQKNQWPE